MALAVQPPFLLSVTATDEGREASAAVRWAGGWQIYPGAPDDGSARRRRVGVVPPSNRGLDSIKGLPTVGLLAQLTAVAGRDRRY